MKNLKIDKVVEMIFLAVEIYFWAFLRVRDVCKCHLRCDATLESHSHILENG
jgi:hypothetical protein